MLGGASDEHEHVVSGTDKAKCTWSALDVHMWLTLPSIVCARATAFEEPVATSNTSRASMTVPTPTVNDFFGTLAQSENGGGVIRRCLSRAPTARAAAPF